MKLICYPIGDTTPRMRPAPATRRWMGDTNQSFAYRCLPLNIANAYGWEILSSAGFSAEWDGTAGLDSVKVIGDSDDPDLPISHFGHGILTFHTHAIFKTEPGYNLFVGGSTNFMKDGLYPLSALIETDWAPYPFTMNWKFTRSHHPIRFEIGEPFCMFYPVQREIVRVTEPEIRDLASDPDLQNAYNQWHGNRENFLSDLNVKGSEAMSAKWQKDYYRGRMPDGEPSEVPHVTKSQPAPFTDKRREYSLTSREIEE
jgi:hypothetical protein